LEKRKRKVDPEVGRERKGRRSLRKKLNLVYRRILEEIEKEVQIHPHYADLQNQFALFLMVGGERGKAEHHFLEALRLNPKYREAHLNLGFLYLEERRWEEAEGIFLVLKSEMALKKIDWSPYAQFHNFIGLTLAKRGKFAQAIEELRKAARLKPDEFIFHANLGTVYYYQGAYPKAIQEFQKALKIDPCYGMGYANLSYTYGLMSRTQEALRCMKKAVQLNPRYADLHYNLALLYSDRRRYEEAVSELKKALRINPNYLLARINLGVLYEDQKKWNEARREYRRILEITPDDEHIRKRLRKIS
jgi:tetratricopeptide (TPR) repeat protein